MVDALKKELKKMTDTTTPAQNLLTMMGDVKGKRIAMDSVAGDFKLLAIELFKSGANIVVSDREKLRVQELNRVLFEMVDSANRYRAVPFGNIMFEPVDIFLALDPTESTVPQNAAFKRKIDWTDSRIQGAASSAKPPASQAAKPAEPPAAAAKPATPTAAPATQPNGVPVAKPQPAQPAKPAASVVAPASK